MTPSDEPKNPKEDEEETEESHGIFRRLIKTGKGVIQAGGNMVGDLALPREIIAYMMKSIDKAKTEVVRIIGEEVRVFLGHVNLTEIITRAMTDMAVEVKAEIKFKSTAAAPSGTTTDHPTSPAEEKETRP